MAEKFEIFTGSDDQFYFRLKAPNHEIILASEGYTTKSNCESGVDSVKENAPDAANYEKETAKDGRYYFNLTSEHNGQTIGTSQMYKSRQSRDEGIEACQKYAPEAEVKDLTDE